MFLEEIKNILVYRNIVNDVVVVSFQLFFSFISKNFSQFFKTSNTIVFVRKLLKNYEEHKQWINN